MLSFALHFVLWMSDCCIYLHVSCTWSIIARALDLETLPSRCHLIQLACFGRSSVPTRVHCIVASSLSSQLHICIPAMLAVLIHRQPTQFTVDTTSHGYNVCTTKKTDRIGTRCVGVRPTSRLSSRSLQYQRPHHFGIELVSVLV